MPLLVPDPRWAEKRASFAADLMSALQANKWSAKHNFNDLPGIKASLHPHLFITKLVTQISWQEGIVYLL